MEDSFSESPLYWKVAELSEYYKDNRLWPSYIGARGGLDEQRQLPVFLWPEQTNFLNKRYVMTDACKTGNKKRKLDSLSDRHDTVINESVSHDNPAPKKAKTGPSSILNAARRAFSFVSEMVHSAAGWFIPSSRVALTANTASTQMPTLTTMPPSSIDPPAKGTRDRPQVIRESNAELSVKNSLLLGISCKMTVGGGLSARSTVGAFRNKVFNDLHTRGYLVCPGEIYGADFGIYKGDDPSQSHSVASVRIISGSIKGDRPKLLAKDLLSFSRVQNQVAKSAVFAFPRIVSRSKNIAATKSSGNSNSNSNDMMLVKPPPPSSAVLVVEQDAFDDINSSTEYLAINFSTVSDRV